MDGQAVVAEVRVNSAELTSTFKLLAKHVKARDKADVVIRYSGGRLLFDIVGVQRQVVAQGFWPGQARVPAAVVSAVAGVPFGSEQVTVKVADGKLYFNSNSRPCVWEAGRRQLLKLSLNAPLWEVLAMAQRHLADDIEASGLTATVAAAIERRDRIMGKATDLLAQLAVKPADLSALVGNCIAKATERIDFRDDEP